MCCGPDKVSILGIDTTYNISDSCYLTPTVYQHLKLVDKNTGKHPTLPGPAMIHNRMDAKTFEYFGNTLIELDPSSWNLRFIGSDRDGGIDKGFKQLFLKTEVHSCKKQVEDNIKVKLRDLGINGASKTEFLKDIFVNASAAEKGLIDSLSKEEFDTKLMALREEWEKRERAARKTKEPKFYTYFLKHIASAMNNNNNEQF